MYWTGCCYVPYSNGGEDVGCLHKLRKMQPVQFHRALRLRELMSHCASSLPESLSCFDPEASQQGKKKKKYLIVIKGTVS